MVSFNQTLPSFEHRAGFCNKILDGLRLSKNKQKKVYLPEDPFPHAQLVKENRIKHYKSLADVKDLRQPCILFCGHPSLRCGDIVHLIEAWGQQSTNALIITGIQLRKLCIAQELFGNFKCFW